MKKKIINLWNQFKDFLFPRTCFCCNSRIENGIICNLCESNLVRIQQICMKCGADNQEYDCRFCKKNDFTFNKARSVFHFEKNLQILIHNLKYDEMTKVAKFLGKYASDYLQKYKPFSKIDIIAPVPLHKVRKRDRGFNQAELLTREISHQMNWLHTPNLILRNRFTQTQTKLGRKDRHKNVYGAFILNSKYDVRNKNILIVDDVFTTGATVNSISTILKDNEARNVFVLTIARA